MIDEVRLIEDIKDDAKRMLAHVFGEVPSEFIDDYLKQMEWLINDQQKISEWIPCSERMPEIEEYILMSLKNLDVAIGFRSNTEDYWYYGGQYLSYDSVVAWMPLPEPYKGD